MKTYRRPAPKSAPKPVPRHPESGRTRTRKAKKAAAKSRRKINRMSRTTPPRFNPIRLNIRFLREALLFADTIVGPTPTFRRITRPEERINWLKEGF